MGLGYAKQLRKLELNFCNNAPKKLDENWCEKSSFLMYIDKMSVKSGDSGNCIYSASSGCRQWSKASFHSLSRAEAVRALGRNSVLLWI